MNIVRNETNKVISRVHHLGQYLPLFNQPGLRDGFSLWTVDPEGDLGFHLFSVTEDVDIQFSYEVKVIGYHPWRHL